MKKVELLCPAGNMKMLEMAIHNGADAVFLAGTKFGARKFSNNFNNEELIEAINYAHLYGVKVYITINTLIKDSEVNAFLSFVEFIHKNGVDAVLMQDLGMIYLVKKMYPNLEVHASTQFHNHNNEGLKFLKDLGIKRAVLARELSIDEIKELDVNIEKEVFVHGALCICYSGECLMSSLVMNRSGNRGECAGMCRLPYKLIENSSTVKTEGDYLLSPKELCTIEHLKEILDCNIDSIKIEGRMKSPEYVGYVTKLYRRAIDNYYENKEFVLTNEELTNLKKLFNRDFTKGYILNDDKNIINTKTPNHIGVEIGTVESVTKDKIKIKLSDNLNQGDAIRFKNSNKGMYANFIYNKFGKLINSAKSNEIIYLDNKIELDKNDAVLKTIDIKLLEQINTFPKKKIPISINVNIKENAPLKIEITDGINKVFELGNIVEKSINQSLTKDIIKEKLSKLGNTIYELENININLEQNCFIPIKELNEMRRNLIEKLNIERMKIKNNFKKESVNFAKNNIKLTNEIGLLIDKEEDYINFKNKNNIIFYTENFELYSKYKDNKNIYFRLPRVINHFKEFKNDYIQTSDIGSITKYALNNNLVADIYSNVTNIYTVKFLTDLGVKKIGISPELIVSETIDLYKSYIKEFNEIPNIEVFAGGYLELMILKYNIVNKNKENIFLQDRNNEKFKIINKYGKNIILNYRNITRIEDLLDTEIKNYYISLIDMKNQEKERIKELIEV